MHGPELLVLDEPTSGLDPLLQRRFRALARECAPGGATIFLSSHMLGEVDEIAGRVPIIREGRVVDVDDVRALRARAGQEILLGCADPWRSRSPPASRGPRRRRRPRRRQDADLPAPGPMPLLGAATRRRMVRRQARDRKLEDPFMAFCRGPRSSEATTSATVADEAPPHPRYRAPEAGR